jgi:hypothetical protein
MGIDIIIALANDKKNNYYELRIALRSIDKYLTGHRNIYLIGEKPGWVQNVIHIPKMDTTRKQYSIYSKFMTASNTEAVSNDFLRWDDDVYLLEPLDISGIKDWHEGTLKEWAYKNINTLYRNVVKNTLKLFPDGLYYDIHAPRKFNKEKYREMAKYPWATQELLTKSTYFNMVQADPVYMADPKKTIGLFYSTGKDNVAQQSSMLKEKFGNPCRFE